MSHRAHLALVRPATEYDEDLGDGLDRRAHERLTLSALSWLDDVRLKYGPSVSLIDLSVGGAQIETDSHRLQPGATVVIELSATDGQYVIPSRVVRSRVSSIAPHTVYRGALEFKRRFELITRKENDVVPADANPIHEHARLTSALRRLGSAHGLVTAGGASTMLGADAMSAALAVIESASGRQIGTPLAREVSRLLRSITRTVESGETSDKLVADIIDRTRRAVPARSVRIVDAVTLIHNPSAVAFDIPSPPGRATKLVVEFPQGRQLEHWHFQLLKTAANLAALATEIDRNRFAAQRDAERQKQHDELYGWNRLVVRYMDGRVLKGYGRDFTAARGHIQVCPEIDSPPETRITVPLAHLKAVFFVHDFDGAVSAPQPGAPVFAGRRIVVTFLDGESLEGTTLNYTPDGPGFFVSPSDAVSNNQRIFVVASAVRHVKLP